MEYVRDTGSPIIVSAQYSATKSNAAPRSNERTAAVWTRRYCRLDSALLLAVIQISAEITVNRLVNCYSEGARYENPLIGTFLGQPVKRAVRPIYRLSEREISPQRLTGLPLWPT